MTRYRLKDVLAGTGGTPRGNLTPGMSFPRLVRDARAVRPGDLYVGIRGERFDGNAFTGDAARNGAAAAIVSREWADSGEDSGIPLIVVDDTIQALQSWANWRRDRLDVTVVGVTGSIGKTSAKESIAAVLGQIHRVYKSPGSYNNEIGLPLSLLEAADDTECMVLEMGGAYAFGELTLLASIAQPQVGVVTNVYPVHLERMGSIEAIAETKTELPRALPASGTAVLNGDDQRVRAMAASTDANVVFYGLGPGNHVRAEQVSTEGLKGTSFWLTIGNERYFVKVPFVGAHGVQVALVAIAVGHAMGMHISDMLAGLQDPATQVRLLVAPGPAGSDLIDDTYNASTPSVMSALALLEEIPATRRIAVLGDMRELGSISDDEHRVVGRRAADVVDILLTYGTMATLIADEAMALRIPGRGPVIRPFQEGQQDAIVDWLRAELREGDVVLFKGSRGLAMETMVRDLRSDVEDPKSERSGHIRVGQS
ncbi:MAG TPA: UDP-N-acetylmuramoyl-tripeptide--D-alanyl-D-alanine ligase [Thermomicrobiales bacterium]|nr:UDP-N-acetylmuramoyl-tripeptide--D-alanyl-D-alanine ligase [Thermomicrobiales bacterium]